MYLDFGDRSVPATVERVNEALDVAILTLTIQDNELASRVLPLFPRHDTKHHDRYRAIGYPVHLEQVKDRDIDRASTTGSISDLHARLGDVPALQLHCLQAASSDPLALVGYSGGPVLAGPDEHVIGIVRWNPRAGQNDVALGGMVYATPITAVLALWPDLASHEPEKPPTGDLYPALLDVDGRVQAIKFLTDHRIAVTAGSDTLIWNPTNGQVVRLERSLTKTRALNVLLNPRLQDAGAGLDSGAAGTIVAVHGDSRVTRWSSSDGALLPGVTVPRALALFAVCLSQDETLLAVGGTGRTVRVYEASSLRKVQEIRSHRVPGCGVPALSWLSNSRHLVTGDQRGAVEIWDVFTPKMLWRDRVEDPVRSLSTGHGFVIVGAGRVGMDKTHLIKVADKTRATFKVLAGAATAIYTPRGALGVVAMGGDSGSGLTWDLSTSTALSWIRHSAAITSLSFSPRGEWLATGGADNRVQLWPTR